MNGKDANVCLLMSGVAW